MKQMTINEVMKKWRNLVYEENYENLKYRWKLKVKKEISIIRINRRNMINISMKKYLKRNQWLKAENESNWKLKRSGWRRKSGDVKESESKRQLAQQISKARLAAKRKKLSALLNSAKAALAKMAAAACASTSAARKLKEGGYAEILCYRDYDRGGNGGIPGGES